MNQSINPATVALFLYIQIVYHLLLDYAMFGLVLTAQQIVGASICLVFSLSAVVYKRYTTEADSKVA